MANQVTVTLNAGQWFHVTQAILEAMEDRKAWLETHPDDPAAPDTRALIASDAVVYVTIWEAMQQFLDKALAGVTWEEILSYLSPEEQERWRKRLGL